MTDLRQGQRPDLPSRDNGALSFWWPGRSMPRARRPGLGDRERMEDPIGTWDPIGTCLGRNSHLLGKYKATHRKQVALHHRVTVTLMLENLKGPSGKLIRGWLLSKFKENQ